MPAASVSREEAIRTIEAVRLAVGEGAALDSTGGPGRPPSAFRVAAEALGVTTPTLRHRLARAKLLYGLGIEGDDPSDESQERRAARLGHAPGHWDDGVAPGYRMGKVTVQRGPGGVERVWERQHPQAETEALESAIAAMRADMPRLAPLPAPSACAGSLMVLYPITDLHIGAHAWRAQGGADWSLQIAERTALGCLELLTSLAPAAEVGMLWLGGDLLHFDGPDPVTPTSRHPLEAAGTIGEIAQAAVRFVRRAVDLLLMRHSRVQVAVSPGNHDIIGSMWLRHLLAALYEREPRLEVLGSETPFMAVQHGRTMLAFHHGHKRKPAELPLLFAAQYPQMWGATTKRFAHVGHRHHEEVKEHAGMKVVQHATLAARDAHAANGGWISERQITAITYHAVDGRVGEIVVTPEMLDA